MRSQICRQYVQRVAGLCMARLREPESTAQTLQLWIKGPVFYGAKATLNAAETENEVRFRLALHGDPRAALVGQWQDASI